MNRYWKILMCVPLAIGLWACDDDDDNVYIEEGVTPYVSVGTPDLTALSGSQILATAEVGAENVDVLSTGFCCARHEKPTIDDIKCYAEDKTGTVSGTLKNLSVETTYYVRAYVLLADKIYYSPVATVTTLEGTYEVPVEITSYVGPTNPDHYVDVSGWADRDKWNLANVHDPSVMLADDGYYYMYQTDASYGNAHDGHGHFHGRRSQDLVNWEYLGGTMAACPSWVKEKLNEYRAAVGLAPIQNPDYGYWAPVVRNCGNGLYRMYYAIVVTDLITSTSNWGERAFIGLMETTNPADNDSWEDKGFVVCSASDQGTNWYGDLWEGAYFRYNAIDPTYIITPEGEHWLIYGSWHYGFAGLQIDPDTGKSLNPLSMPWGTSADAISSYGQFIQSRYLGSRWQASEGPEVVYRNGYYYLFMAYDGLAVPYNTRVVRSTSITGPYVGMDGTDVTNNGGEAYPIVTHPYKFQGDYGWVGISHCAVFSDDNDNWYFSSQGRLPEGAYGNDYANAIMLGQIRSIRWTTDGWPVVMPERYGAVPKIAIDESEVAGNWENIDIQYEYGVQRESASLVLADDHTVTAGIWEGKTWNFDAAQQILTIGGINLYLQRECDWEASGRPATIVYAGYSTDGHTTYWGKKN
ncbi:MAG: arabinan endo-1,5-alpha-L-arabinosidase [Bacteroidales bacterium]|nr:arabinan endo-1,5-alpha-L-arabinosidase [Bacteroidales bacterium]